MWGACLGVACPGRGVSAQGGWWQTLLSTEFLTHACETRMHSSRMSTIYSSSCLVGGESASVHAGIHTHTPPGLGLDPPGLGLGLDTPLGRPPVPGHGPRHPQADPLPLGIGLDTPPVNRMIDRQV